MSPVSALLFAILAGFGCRGVTEPVAPDTEGGDTAPDTEVEDTADADTADTDTADADTDTADTAAPCDDTVVESAFTPTTATWTDGRATLTDDATGAVLVAADGATFAAADALLQPVVTLQSAPNGYDLLVDVQNDSSAPLPLGTWYVAGIQLADGPVTRRPVEDSSSELTLTPTDAGFHYHGAASYPSWMYSPLQVLSDTSWHVGVSLQYPLLTYRHAVMFETWSVASTTGARSYTVQMTLDGELPPGEARRYVVSVRVAPASASWLYTVVPYRNFFRANYGYTRYSANAEPVRGHVTAYTEYCPDQPYGSPENPYGWADLFTPQRRPDEVGWGPWVDQLVTAPEAGFSRVMLWTPTGVFCEHPEFNYPDQFVTRMDEDPVMSGSTGEFARVPAAGLDFGMWWGRSMLQTRPWDAGTQRQLDPSDPEHRDLAFAELDAARALGATTIGLDAFGWNGAGEQEDWASYEWLGMLQAHAPEITFVTEGLTSDLVHTLAPTYTIGSYHTGPHLLADFLNPGYEMWAQVRWELVFADDPEWWNRPVSERHDELRRMAAIGLVPLVIDESTTIPDDLAVTETWRTSVPAELRSACDPR